MWHLRGRQIPHRGVWQSFHRRWFYPLLVAAAWLRLPAGPRPTQAEKYLHIGCINTAVAQAHIYVHMKANVNTLAAS